MDRRGGGTAGGGFEAERRACAGIGGGAREDVEDVEFAEFRRSRVVLATGVGGAGIGVIGLVAGLDGGNGRSSGILSTLLSLSSTGLVLRLPRQRLVFGGSGLIFGLGLFCSVPGGRSVRLGVMTPGFSCCAATSRTLRDDVEAGSRCIPSRLMALGLRW